MNDVDIVYIDTNIFLNTVLYDLKNNQEAKKSFNFLQKIMKKEILGITSSLTWDEFTWIIGKTLGREVAIEKSKDFLVFPNLAIKKVDLTTINQAQNLISKYNIRPRDAIHAACALENNIRTIYSFDDDFDMIKELRRIEP
ncbi:MAG: type II toxin-antitoxin system VapC family toxin [Promethearchaeota archaeon]